MLQGTARARLGDEGMRVARRGQAYVVEVPRVFVRRLCCHCVEREGVDASKYRMCSPSKVRTVQYVLYLMYNVNKFMKFVRTQALHAPCRR